MVKRWREARGVGSSFTTKLLGLGGGNTLERQVKSSCQVLEEGVGILCVLDLDQISILLSYAESPESKRFSAFVHGTIKPLADHLPRPL